MHRQFVGMCLAPLKLAVWPGLLVTVLVPCVNLVMQFVVWTEASQAWPWIDINLHGVKAG